MGGCLASVLLVVPKMVEVDCPEIFVGFLVVLLLAAASLSGAELSRPRLTLKDVVVPTEWAKRKVDDEHICVPHNGRLPNSKYLPSAAQSAWCSTICSSLK